MTDLKRRIKAVETRLGIGGQVETIIIKPVPYTNANAPSLNKRWPKRDGETDAEYLDRINNEPIDETKYLPAETRTFKNYSITMPRRLRPEFADLED